MAKKGFPQAESTRHILIRYYFIKHYIDAGEIHLEYLPTEEMIADILTKPLQGSLFQKLRSKLLNL
jgi:ABC-type nitrate/sulfonate/bicarbonate transport system substrate-binding protein